MDNKEKEANDEDRYVSKDDLANGFEDLPKINLVTQRNLRQNKKITYTKIGGVVYYKKVWITDYINSNTIKKEN